MWQRIGRRLLFPPVLILILFVLISAGLLVYIFYGKNQGAAWAGVVYAFSFYSLVAVCLRLPQMIRFFKKQKRNNSLVMCYASDVQFRTSLFLFSGVAGCLIYGLFQLGLGVYHNALWFYAIAAYYFVLAVMRFFLLCYTRCHKPGENLKEEFYRMRLCGICFIIFHLILAVLIIYVIGRGHVFHHHPITLIAMATYTFVSFTMAIVNLIRYRKYRSPVYVSAKAIGLASASVSMLTLEAAMLIAFDETGDLFLYRMMTGITGTAVSLFVLSMAFFMIWKAGKGLHLLSEKNSEEKS